MSNGANKLDLEKGRQSPHSAASHSLDTVNTDMDSTSSSSKRSTEEQCELHVADDDSQLQQDIVEDPFQYKFRKELARLFDGKANKTVLLTEAQMEHVRCVINEDYTEVLLHEVLADESIEPRHDISVHMRCASHVLGQFWEMQATIQQTRMASTIGETIFLEVEDYIFPRLVDKIHPLDVLKPNVVSSILTWMDEMETSMKQHAPELGFREEWTEERNELLQYYLDHAVRKETRKLHREALYLHSNEDIRHDADGYTVTGLPEQISFVIHQQLRVASECLPHQYVEDVLAVCNEELAALISEWTLKISAEWEALGCEYYCAVINDASRLSDYCDEHKQDYITREDLMEAADSLVRDITELSLHATRYLCECIFHCLREPESILTAVGNAEWEDPEAHSPVDRAVATFKDFFADIDAWLIPGYFFPKVLKNCFDLALKTYLESFFANTMVNGVTDATAVAEELEQDYLRFVVFFNGEQFVEFHGRGGFYSLEEINNRLRFLQHMAALVDPTNLPWDLSFEIQEILASFGCPDDGDPAVLHLVGLRNKFQRAPNSVRWVKQIASAKKELAARTQTPTPFLCFLPDVSNSKMLRKIAPPRRAHIPREISEESMPYAQSTTRLLERNSRFSRTRETVSNTVLQYAQRKLNRKSWQTDQAEPADDTHYDETREPVVDTPGMQAISDSEEDDDERLFMTCTMGEF